MASLTKRRTKYYSRISVRIGTRYSMVNGIQKENHKKKYTYINLATDNGKYAIDRNAIVQREEDKIREQIRRGILTKSDLLNINDSIDWGWLKCNGTKTSRKVHTIEEYVNRFIKHSSNRNKKESTIITYGYALKRFVKYLGKYHLIQDTNNENIDDFIEHLQNEGLALSSIDSNLKSISSFLNWCVKRNYLEKCPNIELFNPIIEDKWLTEHEYNQMIDTDNFPNDRFPKMYKLYAETGMRLKEGFYGILTEDNNGIWLSIPNESSKSGKGRTIQLNEEQRDTIQMIQTLWIEGGSKIDHIKYYSKVFRQIRNKLGIDNNKTFHSLRHYFGKTMVTITGNIYLVSGLMGHSSVKVTESNYVKHFDRKSTLRDFPSLKKYLITDKNKGNKAWGTTIGGQQSWNLMN